MKKKSQHGCDMFEQLEVHLRLMKFKYLTQCWLKHKSAQNQSLKSTWSVLITQLSIMEGMLD